MLSIALSLALIAAPPTIEEARQFLQRANAELKAAWSFRERTGFVNLTYLTDDTDLIAAQANERAMETSSRLIKESQRFRALTLPSDLARQLHLLRLADSFPAPDDPKSRTELAEISAQLTSIYGKGQHCATDPKTKKEKCYKLDELEELLRTERSYERALELWVGWHKISPPMKDKFAREVELANAGAKAIGFKDVGELWRSGYDMTPEAFEQDTERLYEQLRPLYEQLHCYVRARLSKKYGADKVPLAGAIPAHLFGNMWAQEWGNIYDLVEPYPGQSSPNVTKAMANKKWDVMKMFKLGEGFFTSLGLDPLPATFWTRSMFVRPRDREVVCHASAWDISYDGDLRVKMCTQVNEDDFITIHHELGHDFYYQQYAKLPALFQAGANDGFHEGIGDTLALSITPAYLQKIGLFDKPPPRNEKAAINEQMKSALDKIAFLPFGLLIDRWRWEAFSGRIGKDQYNTRWWELRKKYQGVDAPVARSEADFDPGAKYHVPANVPYTRYFLARLLQFQFHRGLCKAAGHTGPIHECSIAGNKAAGEKLRAMLAMGASRPWPEALNAITGEKQIDATALADYFAPLEGWLKKQNEGQRCGW